MSIIKLYFKLVVNTFEFLFRGSWEAHMILHVNISTYMNIKKINIY